ncbi:hypothetical protein ACFXAF_01985 [Kitasatospora sp. NPDC059463]|uniref:hypothetical protein n=1 Tax=unclassified Kitasatospora TaxID=2633591 RepID=UPI003691A28F
MVLVRVTEITGDGRDDLRATGAHVTDPDAVAAALLGGTLGINIQHRLDPDLDRRRAVTAMTGIYTDALSATEPSRRAPGAGPRSGT